MCWQVLAGALQDSGRASIVGETTYGKGLIQTIVELSDGSAVVITVARYQVGHAWLSTCLLPCNLGFGVQHLIITGVVCAGSTAIAFGLHSSVGLVGAERPGKAGQMRERSDM